MPSPDRESVARGKDERLVVPLDGLRALDVGILTSVGGFASASLYTVASGTNVYVRNIVATPFSGFTGVIRLLDGTTAKTGPLFITYAQSGSVITSPGSMRGGIELGVQPGRFVSGVVVEIMSAANNLWPVQQSFAGSLYCEVLVDPRALAE